MTASSSAAARALAGRRIVPAHLDFLAIYSPSLSTADADERNQILFFHSALPAGGDRDNEELRQIGLAQGIVHLARGFSRDHNPDCIDTDKHRIVLSEVEPGWWILASINLTRIPTALPAAADPKSLDTAAVEYSAREVSPAALLLQQLACAWRIFLLHQASSIQSLYDSVGRHKLCTLLHIYWSAFARDWDVLLHGNPAVEIHNGIKLAAGGELGIGVGEEEWGSGERDVLEDLVRNSQGAVDLVVGRFGDCPKTADDAPWLGQLQKPGPNDGLVFSGVGNLTSEALRTLSDWACHIYTLGHDAYGLDDNPGAGRIPRRRRPRGPPPPLPKAQSTGDEEATADAQTQAQEPAVPLPSIPPPIVGPPEPFSAIPPPAASSPTSPPAPAATDSYLAFPDAKTWKNVLSLGYGSVWSIPGLQKEPSDDSAEQRDSAESVDTEPPKKPLPPQGGSFLIGLGGSLEPPDPNDETDLADDLNKRLAMRTIHVELHAEDDATDDAQSSAASEDLPATSTMTPIAFAQVKRLRVVIYIHQPFMYLFLFEMGTGALSMPDFYRGLHAHLTPLHKQLLDSTSPANVASRLQSVLPSGSSPVESRGSPIYELLYNPYTMTVHTSIPNIPLPITAAGPASLASLPPPWTRAEALNVHAQILGKFAETRRLDQDREHTTKTSRGWWVVWMRLVSANRDPWTSGPGRGPTQGFREAILVRRASDHAAPVQHGSRSGGGSRASSLGLGRFLGRDAGASSPDTFKVAPSRLTEGVGVDPRKYVESLLSLNR